MALRAQSWYLVSLRTTKLHFITTAMPSWNKPESTIYLKSDLHQRLIGSVPSSHHFHRISSSPSLKSFKTSQSLCSRQPILYIVLQKYHLSHAGLWMFLYPEYLLLAILVGFHAVDHLVNQLIAIKHVSLTELCNIYLKPNHFLWVNLISTNRLQTP